LWDIDVAKQVHLTTDSGSNTVYAADALFTGLIFPVEAANSHLAVGNAIKDDA